MVLGAHGEVYCRHSAEATDGFVTVSAALMCDASLFSRNKSKDRSTIAVVIRYRLISLKRDSSQYKVYPSASTEDRL